MAHQVDISCFICGGKFKYFLSHFDSWLHTSDKKYDIYRCEKCQLLKIIPEPTVDEIKTFYPGDYYSYSIGKNPTEEAAIDQLLKSYYDYSEQNQKDPPHIDQRVGLVPLHKPKLSGNFLDIGCGDGYWLKKLRPFGWKCYGVEFQGEGGEGITIGDFLQTEFPVKFEYIRFCHTLEHVRHPDKYIEKIKNILEEGGECHIGIPNTGSIGFKLFKETWLPLDVPRHLHGFSDKNIRLLVEKKGLKVKKIEYAGIGSLYSSWNNMLKIKKRPPLPRIANALLVRAMMVMDNIFNAARMSDAINVVIKR